MISMGKPSPTLVKISELARLSDVPAPTIKHYMREGLLPGPARRTSRNMAYYDAGLADRIRAIKDLQQSRFLPLKVIADLLEPAPSAKLRDDRLAEIAPAIRQGQADARRRRGESARPRRRTRKEVLASMKLTGEELDQLADLGLAEPTRPARGEPYYSDADLALLEVIHETRVRKLGDLFPMSILEPYVACIRTLVRVELELFRERVLEGNVPTDKPLPEVAREATQLAERMIIAMRSKLVFPELEALARHVPATARAPKNGKK